MKTLTLKEKSMYEIKFTHNKRIPYKNISQGTYLAIDKQIQNPIEEKWKISEKGYLTKFQAEKRANELTKNGEYSSIIIEYSIQAQTKFIKRDKNNDIIPNIEPKYLMATKAYHLLGDISSEKYEPCCVFAEDEEFYYGSWLLGLGFVDIQFPKSSTRLANEEEKKYWENKKFGIFGSESNKFSYNISSPKF